MSASDLGDAALYAHLQGQDAAATELVRDELHLARLLRKDVPPNQLERERPLLVAAAMDAAAMSQLLTIVSAVKLTADPADAQRLQITTARQLIHELLDQQSADELIKQILGPDDAAGRADVPAKQGVARKTLIAQRTRAFNRGNAERTLAAMSLACHLFRADKNRWSESLQEIVPAYLPRVPVDPWGNGTETFACVLIKGGLPDASDRPLVYSRCDSQDGLFFHTDVPHYDFYVDDVGKKRGGQFRDVARWAPVAGRRVWPTTQPLR